MIPFYTFYSMFGFQRIGDQLWAAGDGRARGFLMGATSGRTTLNGEGLQHQDGQGLFFASAYPTCQAYDPSFSYEVAVLVQQGIKRMFRDGEDIFYYITLLNENYAHPAMPEGVEEGIGRGMYLFRAPGKGKAQVQLMGSGAIFLEVIAAADMLRDEYAVEADVWSILGVNQLHRDGLFTEDWNRSHPEQTSRISYVRELLQGHGGPAIISTDYVSAYGEQIRRLMPNPLTILGTDGFGRSDSRQALRRFFKVDRYHIVIAALRALADQQSLPLKTVGEAIRKYGVNPDETHPITR